MIVYIFICVHEYMHMSNCVFQICVFLSVYAYMYVYAYVSVSMYVSECMFMFVCMCVYCKCIITYLNLFLCICLCVRGAHLHVFLCVHEYLCIQMLMYQSFLSSICTQYSCLFRSVMYQCTYVCMSFVLIYLYANVYMFLYKYSFK